MLKNISKTIDKKIKANINNHVFVGASVEARFAKSQKMPSEIFFFNKKQDYIKIV